MLSETQNNLLRALVFTIMLGCAFWACNETLIPQRQILPFDVPALLPDMDLPSDNIPTKAQVELGRFLFYDKGLSKDQTVSCASCHQQSHGFADTAMVSLGVSGENGSRNAQAIVNVGYNKMWFWDGRAPRLEIQVQTALLGAAEMNADTTRMIQRIAANANYRRMFASAYSDDSAITTKSVVYAIASFCRSLVSASSRFDQFLLGDKNALSAQEQRGLVLFNSDRTRCANCHSGINFSDEQFHSIALHTHYLDKGLFSITRNQLDIGKFRTPTLRNIAVTGPYTNEGIFKTLEEVVDHYNRGGQPFPLKDTSLIRPLNLDTNERRDLVAFLRSLTDEKFLNNPAFANPFP